MDVAHMTGRAGRADLNLQASRAMRRTVQEVNPEALLVAEHPFDASDVLQGDAYHGTMNYAGFARPVWSWMGVDREVEFLGLPVPIPPQSGPTVAATMSTVRGSLPWSANLHAFNQLGSHDTARFRTVVGGADAGPTHVAAAALLLTVPGIPVVFAGDEIGLEGRDTLQARRPFPWDQDHWDHDTLAAYRELIALRRTHTALRRGGFRWAHVGDDVLSYLRELPDERLLVTVARAPHAEIALPADTLAAARATPLFGGEALESTEGRLVIPGARGPAARVWALEA